MRFWTGKMQIKLSEALAAVVPVIVIVLLLSFTIAPISSGVILSFLTGAVFVIVGMMFFTLGAEMSMTPMGEKVGATMTKTKKVWFIILLSFVLGVIITISEPDLLVTIANQGYSEVIMDAAREVHAAGGTIIHAKGTGSHLAEKFMGMTLVPEKEMIFIVVRTGQKNAIMQAILQKAGTGTKAGAIVFSLPVTDTAGMRLMEELEEEQ